MAAPLEGELPILDKLREVGADLLDGLLHPRIAGEKIVVDHALSPDVAQVVRVETEVGPLGLSDTERDVQLADAVDRVEAAHVPDAVLVHHTGSDGVVGVSADGLLEMVGKVCVDELDHVDLARMARGRIADVEVLGVAGPRELDEHVLGGVVLVVPPVAAAFAPPVAPVHGAVVALRLDAIEVAVDEQVLGPIIVGFRLRPTRRGDRPPDPAGDGLRRVGGGHQRRVRASGECVAAALQVQPDLPPSRLAGPEPVAVALEEVLVLIPRLHVVERSLGKRGEEPDLQSVGVGLETLGPLLPEVAHGDGHGAGGVGQLGPSRGLRYRAFDALEAASLVIDLEQTDACGRSLRRAAELDCFQR